MHIKNSYGIICIRFNHKKNVKEVLMVKKRTTYSYEKIANGNYKIEERNLRIIFNKTTINEKMEILERDFDRIWKKVFYDIPNNTNNNQYYKKYIYAKEKYENLCTYDGGKFLRYILENSKSVSTLWDFTKGRKLNNELILDAAIREFYEETCIDIKNIMFIPQYNKTHIIDTNSVIYKSRLFLAIQRNTEDSSSEIPEIYLRNKNQITEIIELKWLSLAELIEVDVLNRLVPTVKKFMKEVKHRYNNGKIRRHNN